MQSSGPKVERPTQPIYRPCHGGSASGTPLDNPAQAFLGGTKLPWGKRLVGGRHANASCKGAAGCRGDYGAGGSKVGAPVLHHQRGDGTGAAEGSEQPRLLTLIAGPGCRAAACL